MKIKIDCNLEFDEATCLQLAISLIKNRPPKSGEFNYGLETHGVLDGNTSMPIQVYQTNKRLSKRSPIHICIENHLPF